MSQVVTYGRVRRGGQGRILALGAAVLAIAIVYPLVRSGVQRNGLPLSDTAIIRKQAGLKHLDPALIAAVIYAESKFEPRQSSAGAEGLMQILPQTAYYIAHLSGGSSFTAADLATPQINVAYGSYYLRYLLDHYNGNEMLAVAAYNGGLTNVDKWVVRAREEGQPLTIESIPFSETRAYVRRVLNAQQEYRARYAHELGV
ncbi:MAG: lytic transglycosylase domain-containing protein [Solirubrobacteraceae bacterium]